MRTDGGGREGKPYKKGCLKRKASMDYVFNFCVP